jgi:hypothetical protein
MTIEKNNKNTLKNEESGFTTLINETVWSIRDGMALCIYTYLSTKPTNWNICKKHLQNHFHIGRDKVDKAFKYLKEVGALEITMNRDKEGQCAGWTTVLKRKIAASIQITENPYSGVKHPVDNSSSRSLKIQILDNPDSGKTAPTKQRDLKKKEIKETNRTPVSVSVFSCSKDVQKHIEYVASMKHLTLSPDQVAQVLFYIGDTLEFNAISKSINIAFKLIREKRWNIPSGWNGITASSVAKKEALYEHEKQIRIIEDEKNAQKLKQEILERGIIPGISFIREHKVKETHQPTQAFLNSRSEIRRSLGI